MHEPRAQAVAACPGLDEQHPQLCDAALGFAAGLVACLHEEHATGVAAVELGDPARLALRIELLDEACRDVRHQRLKTCVPAVFLGIERAVARNDPADVAGARRAQHGGGVYRLGAAEQVLDARHGREQLMLLGVGEPSEQGADLVARALVQRGEGAAPGSAQAQQALPRVVAGTRGAHQALVFQAGQ